MIPGAPTVNASFLMKQAYHLDDMPASFFYESKEDLLQKIDYYLTHEEEKAAIARNGHDKVSAAHTYRHRVKEMLERV